MITLNARKLVYMYVSILKILPRNKNVVPILLVNLTHLSTNWAKLCLIFLHLLVLNNSISGHNKVNLPIFISIVLYSQISKVPLREQPNQRFSQCRVPRKERKVFRVRAETAIPPVKIMEHVIEVRSFQSKGPTNATQCWALAVQARGTKRSCRSTERRGRPEAANGGLRIKSQL